MGSRLGFLVHDLWPQGERDYPTECNPGAFVQRRDLAATRGVLPSEGLARYEWRKHGTCSGLSPARYFEAMATLHRRIVVPEAYKSRHRTAAPRPSRSSGLFRRPIPVSGPT